MIKEVAVSAASASHEIKLIEDPKYRQNGGMAMEHLLRLTPLIDANYLIFLYEVGGIVPPCQEVPSAARIGPDEAWRLRCWAGFGSLAVLAISAPFLDRDHPDALGVQLKRLVPILKAMVATARQPGCPHGTVGVFWPYMCIPQAPFVWPEAEGPRHAAAMRQLSQWFVHACTHALLLRGPMPPRAEGKHEYALAYEARGWQCFEEQAATLIKYPQNLWELRDQTLEARYEALYKQLRVAGSSSTKRKPPLSPTRMAAKLQSAHWERGDEAAHAASLYELAFTQAFEGFFAAFPGRSMLMYNDSGWDDAAAEEMAHALRYVAAHCRLQRPLTLSVFAGNEFGREAWEALEEVTVEGGSNLRVK